MNSEWTTEEWVEFSVWLTDMLKTNVITLNFTKKDGTERVMRCTLQPDLLPKVEHKTELKERKPITEQTAIPVYDLDNNGWRSFTLNTVKRVGFELTTPEVPEA
jgi:hypothetical protein